MNESDNDLLKRYVNRDDHDAFEKLVRRHSKMILGVCLNILVNRQDSEDAFQNIFMLLSFKSGKLLAHQSIGGWLHETSLRTCFSLRRKLSRKREVNVEKIHEKTVEDHWQQISIQNDTEEIHREIASLPEKYRNVIVLCHLEGMSRSQAAGMLNTTTASVKSTLTRARQLLRTRLLRHGIATTGAVTLATCQTSQVAAEFMATESLIQSTLDACGALNTSGAGNASGLELARQAGTVGSTGFTGAALATAVGVFLFGIGAMLFCNGHGNRVPHLSMMETSIDQEPLPLTLASLDMPSVNVNQEPDPQEPVQDPQEREQDPEDPVEGELEAIVEAMVQLESTDKARLGRVVGDISQLIDLTDEQRQRLEVAAKGAVKKIVKARQLASERLAALQNGAQEEEMDADEFRLEFQGLISGLFAPPPAEESAFWMNEVEKVLSPPQFKIYTERVESRRESLKKAEIAAFVANVDQELLLSANASKKLSEFVAERYVPRGGERPWSMEKELSLDDREILQGLLGDAAMEAWTEDLDERIAKLIYQ